MTRPPRLRRSCHSVPGGSERMLERARELPADLVFMDLEDSVPPDAKSDARARVAEVLAARSHHAPTVGVRVNPVGGPHCHLDLAAVVGRAGGQLDVVILPKVEDAGHVAFADHLLSGLEAEAGLPLGRIGLEAQIESAGGLLRAPEIAAAAPGRLEALVLGAGDLAASLGMPQTIIGAPLPDYPGDGWHHALARIVMAARAHGLQAVDGPHVAIGDLDGLRASALRSRALGYDGKWSLHPAQIEPLNEVYGVPQADFDRALDLLDAYARAVAEGRGAALHGEEMIDEASRRLAERLVERGRLAGMRRSGPHGPTA